MVDKVTCNLQVYVGNKRKLMLRCQFAFKTVSYGFVQIMKMRALIVYFEGSMNTK